MDSTYKKDNKNIVLILIATLIAAIIAGFVIYSLTHDMQQAPTKELTIKITDKGFVPSEVYVSNGSNVIWVNETEVPQKIASDPYGANANLPSLKSGVLGPKEKYAFTLGTIGKFGYHSELDPPRQGLIVVE